MHNGVQQLRNRREVSIHIVATDGLSPNLSVSQIQILQTGVPISGRWRPHPIGQLLPFTDLRLLSFERQVHSRTCPIRRHEFPISEPIESGGPPQIPAINQLAQP
ncbi:hypothetical protein BCAR13_730028 [Paraburkholderia caribensis]|nr:hypothetical protein BCAR13_730028 [Paraburkholderia caribensis]